MEQTTIGLALFLGVLAVHIVNLCIFTFIIFPALEAAGKPIAAGRSFFFWGYLSFWEDLPAYGRLCKENKVSKFWYYFVNTSIWITYALILIACIAMSTGHF